MITSPTRPMAWLSEDIIESAPMSCRMSSAAMVSLRMRLSAKARSSGIDGSRWWQTMSMSRCSSSVFTVKGRVGLVEDGRTFGEPRDLDDVGRVAAARALRVEGVDGAALEGRDRVLDEARFVQRVGVDHHLDVVVVGDARQLSMAAGVVPQSSCSLSAQAPASIISTSAPGREALPLPDEAEVDRERVEGLEHRRDVPGSGRAGGGVGALPRGRCRRRASW